MIINRQLHTAFRLGTCIRSFFLLFVLLHFATYDDFSAMDDALGKDPVHYDNSVKPPIFGNQQGLSVLQRLTNLEKSQASLQDSHRSLQMKIAELEPTKLCAEIIREPVLNIQAGLSTELDVVSQRNRAPHGGTFLADRRTIDERFATNPSQAFLWAARALPGLYGIDYAHAEAAAASPELVAVLNLHADAKELRGFRHRNGCLYGTRKLLDAWVMSLEDGEEFDIYQEPWFKYYTVNKITL